MHCFTELRLIGLLSFLVSFSVLGCGGSGETPGPGNPSPSATGSSATGADSIFTDVTAAAGIDFIHTNGAVGKYQIFECMTSGGAFFDYDNDGFLDVFLTQANDYAEPDPSVTSRLYRNRGDGTFVDVTTAAGVGLSAYALGAAAADYDRDGDTDLFITCVGPDVLYRNNGDGTFADVTEEVGLSIPKDKPQFSASSGWFDYDRDGDLDLYVTRYCLSYDLLLMRCTYPPSTTLDYCGPEKYPITNDVLFRNEGGERFTDVTREAGIEAYPGHGFAILSSDFNGDGWLDLYVANDRTVARLWINQKNGSFVDRAMVMGAAVNMEAHPIAGMGLAGEDFDEDGDFDLFITNMAKEANLFLRNSGTLFEDYTFKWGKRSWSTPWTGFGLIAFDQNHDTRFDLFIANGGVMRPLAPPVPERPYDEPNQFMRQLETRQFVAADSEIDPAILAPDRSRGVAMADYDNDGDLDLLVCRTNSSPQLLRNNESSGRHWLMVKTVDEKGLSPVLNAVITVEAGQRRLMREVRTHMSYLTTSDPRAHFGLGDIDRIDRLTVKWPDGRVESWTGIAVDQVQTIRYGTGAVE